MIAKGNCKLMPKVIKKNWFQKEIAKLNYKKQLQKANANDSKSDCKKQLQKAIAESDCKSDWKMLEKVILRNNNHL